MQVTLGRIVRYTTLPGILPRARDLFLSFTTQLAVMVALAFAAVRLLPPNHPYLNRANSGRFGIRDVMAVGRANLVFRRENADQIVLYYSIALGFVLLVLQAITFLLSISLHGAHAASIGYWSSFFVTPAPEGDIAFLLLDHVFGVPGVFGSCVDPNIACPAVSADGTHPVFINEGTTVWPTPVHVAMQTMFNFYNLGVACVGILIFLYLVATTVAETARSGTPFGQRFNKSWAIPRMMIALALLTPLSLGLNGAQWLTLYIAKWGSGLATNAWITFNQTVATTTPLGNPDQLVPDPTASGYNVLPQFMLVARTCMQAEAMMPLENGGAGRTIKAYQVQGDTAWDMPASFTDALANANNATINIVFGEQHTDYSSAGHSGGANTYAAASVAPICGTASVQIHDVVSPGALKVEEEFYDLIGTLWTDPQNDTYAQNIVMATTPAQKDPTVALPDQVYIESRKDWFEAQVAQAVQDGVTAERNDPRWTESYTDLGWAGASIWYNRIAEYNEGLISALRNLPQPVHYPDIMEHNTHLQGQTQNNTDPFARYCLPTNSGYPLDVRDSREFYISQSLCRALSYWPYLAAEENQPTGSPVGDILKKIFGVKGLFDLRNNVNVSPLAQLVAIGRDLINASELALGGDLVSVFLNLGGKAVNSGMLQMLSEMLSTFSSTIISVTLGMGFLLFYVLPFLPFVYVFFALGGWVKAIFQAMIGLPLWALAHIRIDGDGIPGDAALDGYFIVFEIFIRPTIIIFGLIASVSIFSAQVQVLNQIWDLVTANLTGVNAETPMAASAGVIGYIRNYVDIFAYTILYATVVYMLGLSSFKLIDLLPTAIMRWLGKADLEAFGLGDHDSGGQLMSGAQSMVQDIQGIFGQGVYGLLFSKK